MTFDRIACVHSDSPAAREGFAEIAARYELCDPEDAEVIVALGGDGLMLSTLHEHLERRIPVFGMHRGTVGFLMNEFGVDDLPERLAAACPETLFPLAMRTQCVDGVSRAALAINEVSLMRQTAQAAHLRIAVNGINRLPELVCDGVLVSTPAGSTAYNLSAHGPVVPLGARVLALTPISPFRPRRWRGALLPHDAEVEIEVLDPAKRPVAASADAREVRDVTNVVVREEREHPLTVLFDPGHGLEERILREQFE